MAVIVFAISSLECGGAEKAVTLIAEEFLDRGHNIYILTLSHPREDFFRVKTPICRLWVTHRNLTGRLFDLRKLIVEVSPTVVISFLDQMNVMVLAACLGTRIPVIVSEHVDQQFKTCPLKWRIARRLLYPFAKYLVGVSKGVDDGFRWIPKHKRRIINGILSPEAVPPTILEVPHKTILAAGRLTKQKGFDLLIRAFSQIADRHPNWNLNIVGEGEEQMNLEKLILDRRLEKRVFLQGHVDDLYAKMRMSDIFILSSRMEGFGSVLIEAMACGLPVISFDCPSGPSEIIEDYENGILIAPENVMQLSRWMHLLINDPIFRAELSANALKSIEKYRAPYIVSQWENLFSPIQSKGPARDKVSVIHEQGETNV